MEAQAAAQQLAQAAAQQAVLGCRSPVSVFKHNVLRWQVKAQTAVKQLAQAAAQQAVLGCHSPVSFFLHITSSASRWKRKQLHSSWIKLSQSELSIPAIMPATYIMLVCYTYPCYYLAFLVKLYSP
jgi:hypothetical protein